MYWGVHIKVLMYAIGNNLMQNNSVSSGDQLADLSFQIYLFFVFILQIHTRLPLDKIE